MPNYDYKCICGHEFEEYRTVDERYNVECPKCGETPRMKIGKVNFINDVVRNKDGKYGDYNPGLGEYVTSKSDMIKKAKAKGLEWIGDDPVPKKKKEDVTKKVDWGAVYHDLDKQGVKN
jgi:putative FmdB family regulatory protein